MKFFREAFVTLTGSRVELLTWIAGLLLSAIAVQLVAEPALASAAQAS